MLSWFTSLCSTLLVRSFFHPPEFHARVARVRLVFKLDLVGLIEQCRHGSPADPHRAPYLGRGMPPIISGMKEIPHPLYVGLVLPRWNSPALRHLRRGLLKYFPKVLR
jgi:hypothetical protein